MQRLVNGSLVSFLVVSLLAASVRSVAAVEPLPAGTLYGQPDGELKALQGPGYLLTRVEVEEVVNMSESLALCAKELEESNRRLRGQPFSPAVPLAPKWIVGGFVVSLGIGVLIGAGIHAKVGAEVGR